MSGDFHLISILGTAGVGEESVESLMTPFSEGNTCLAWAFSAGSPEGDDTI